MIQIRPVSDLRNKFTEIEETIKVGNPVYLTKNGYGSMVIMSIETYSNLTNAIDNELEKAEIEARKTKKRYTHKEVFDKLKKECNE